MHFGGGAPSSCLFPQSAGSKNKLGHMHPLESMRSLGFRMIAPRVIRSRVIKRSVYFARLGCDYLAARVGYKFKFLIYKGLYVEALDKAALDDAAQSGNNRSTVGTVHFQERLGLGNPRNCVCGAVG